MCFLTVCVKKGQNFPLSNAGTQQPGSDQALPLRLPHHTDDLQLMHKYLKLFLQVVYGSKKQRMLSKHTHPRRRAHAKGKFCFGCVVATATENHLFLTKKDTQVKIYKCNAK